MENEPTMLLVEDEEQDVLLTKRAIRKAQIRCTLKVVSHGDMAVDYLRGDGIYADRLQYPVPDLILLDLKLPRRSGHEVLAWIRQQPVLRQLLVVVLTSSKETEDLRRAYSLGANSYLIKPVQFDDLLKLLRTVHQYWVDTNVAPPVT